MRVLSTINASIVIVGGSEVVRDSLAYFSHLQFPHELLRFYFRQILSAVSDIVAGLLFSSAIVWQVYLGSCLYSKGYLVSRCSKIPGETDTILQEIYWEVFSLPSCLVVKIPRRYIGLYSLLYNGITLVSVFLPHSIEEEIIK